MKTMRPAQYKPAADEDENLHRLTSFVDDETLIWIKREKKMTGKTHGEILKDLVDFMKAVRDRANKNPTR